jgi:hypothetical protein
MRSIEPGILRFPDAQLRIWGLVLTHHSGMTEYFITSFFTRLKETPHVRQ